MLRLDDGEVAALRADGYQLLIGKSNSCVAKLVAGDLLAELFVLSGCHANGRPDYSYGASPPAIYEVDGGLVVEVTSASTVWESKRYVFACFEDRLEYYYVVRGVGAIDDCEFFQGFVGTARPAGPDKPWVNTGWEAGLYGRMRSKAHFDYLFNPEPNGVRKQLFSREESATIGVRSNKSYCRGNWFFTPGPFCYALSAGAGTWLTLGLVVKPGQNNFVEYGYQGGNGFGLSLGYEGRMRVDGEWESPHIVFFRSDDEYTGIRRYCDHLRGAGYVPDGKRSDSPWWREPIFCGWGEQSYLSNSEGCARKTPTYATQEVYERFVSQLEQRGLNPGTIILDDKWQEFYGDPLPDPAKWPDLAGFISRQHAAGRHVLLWLKAWDAEGVPPEECLVDAHGKPVAVDPSNPEYERRLRRCIRALIADLDADGFKLDFTANLPLDGASRDGSGRWGVELLRHLLWIIYSEAKKAKKDALIIAHAVNPYFADVVDMVRLNDVAILSDGDSYAESMVHRQRVAEATSPDWLIDTDNWPSPTLASWLEYVRLQPALGVPSLYYVTHIDESGEEIGEMEAQEVAGLWAEYRAALGGTTAVFNSVAQSASG